MSKLILIKKKKKDFNRHHSDRYNRLKKSWRKPRGIDNCVRRRFKGKTLMPNIGYGSDKNTRNKSKRGLYKLRIQNCNELDMLAMSNRIVECEIAKKINKINKIKIFERALELDIKVSNPPDNKND
jgi:large subunit ribosomal protein L32e